MARAQKPEKPAIEPARKPYKKRTQAEKERDAEWFMRLHLQKYSYLQIADMFMEEFPEHSISHQTVFDSIKAQTNEWKKVNQETVNRAIMKALAVLDLVELEAWKGYARSCQDAEQTTTVHEMPKLPGGEIDQDNLERVLKMFEKLTKGDGLPLAKETIRRNGQAGDSSFLRVITHCQHVRAKLFESVSLQPKLSDGLLKLAKAMGVKTDDS